MLDRMGGSVVEVRDAYRRFVSREPTEDAPEVESRAIRAMVELRVPPEVAEAACRGAGSDLGRVSFSEFVARYAEASGLAGEVVPRRGGQVWAEGPGGRWVRALPSQLGEARSAFDEAAGSQETVSGPGGNPCGVSSLPLWRRVW